MVKEKYKSMNLIHSDSIKWGIIRGIRKEKYYRENIEAQKEFEHSGEFQKILIEIFLSSIRNDKGHGYILESGQLDIGTLKEMIDFENTIVVCLGHGDLKKEDIISLCRNHDKEEDWTYDISDDDLEKHAKKWEEMNESLKMDCNKYKIKYIDTSKDRVAALNYALNYIVDEINK